MGALARRVPVRMTAIAPVAGREETACARRPRRFWSQLHWRPHWSCPGAVAPVAAAPNNNNPKKLLA